VIYNSYIVYIKLKKGSGNLYQNMKYNTQLAKFNAGRGTMLILRILGEKSPLDKKTLQEEFEKYGLGGSTFNTSMQTCYDLELVIAAKEKLHIRGTISLMHSLTEKGKKLAKLVAEIDVLLN
jgi:hypothetical protein